MVESHRFPLNEDELSEAWKMEGARYASAVNAYRQRAAKLGWDKAGKEPVDTRSRLAVAVMKVVRRANQEGNRDDLRARFPPAHQPFLSLLEKNGQSLPRVLLLDDGRIVLRIGSEHVGGKLVLIDDTQVTPLDDDILTVDRSPDRRYFAVGRIGGIIVHDGWEGPVVSRFSWPTGREGLPEGYSVPVFEGPLVATRLIPFPEGDRVLLVSPDGVFVLDQRGAKRLLPTRVELMEDLKDMRERQVEKPWTPYQLSMEHGAISPDGRWIATGHQSSVHFVFDARTLKVAGEIGSRSEYPHYAVFSSDGAMLALNSCHFYSGATIGVATRRLPGIKTEQFGEDRRTPLLQDGARVYAAVSREGEFIVGDASGTLIAFDEKGNERWDYTIGSSMGDIDISPDGKRLVATTFAGFLSIFDLDTGENDPCRLGTGKHTERRRWLFWTDEPAPLIW